MTPRIRLVIARCLWATAASCLDVVSVVHSHLYAATVLLRNDAHDRLTAAERDELAAECRCAACVSLRAELPN